MRDAGHLLRVAAVFAAGLVIFIWVRTLLVPRSFGQYGHFRGEAISEIAALPVAHAGHQTCETCHTEILDLKKNGKHAAVACEACHGPQASHAGDPAAVVPVKPDPAVLCARCHESSAAKPKWFPQVATAEHSGGLVCNMCHQPHSPALNGAELSGGGAK